MKFPIACLCKHKRWFPERTSLSQGIRCDRNLSFQNLIKSAGIVSYNKFTFLIKRSWYRLVSHNYDASHNVKAIVVTGYGWSNVAKYNEIVLCVQRNNYFYSTNFLHILRNNYFDSTNYLYIQRKNYFHSTNYFYI